MSKPEDGLSAMMDLWKQGQETFLKAQAEMGETLQKTMAGSSTPSGTIPKPDEMMGQMSEQAMAGWQAFMNAWAPAANPLSALSDNLLKQGLSGFPDFGSKGFLTPFSLGGADIAGQMLDPQSWSAFAPEELRKILQMIADGPRFADLATPQIEVASAWAEVIDYQKAAAELFTVLQGAWVKTYERYAENHAIEDLQSGNVDEALQAWLKAANDELLEVQRTPDFMDAQKRMMRAGLEIKLRQRDIAEQWSEKWQMPTRTEVDDLSQMVQELRREVRKLKRELAKKQ